MSGVKRRSGYRKGVIQGVLYGTPEPEGPHQSVARIRSSPGANIFEIALPEGKTGLALLPTKFRKLTWLKRGDFVIVNQAEGDVETAAGTEGSVSFMIEHILYADAIKNLRQKGLWPVQFEDLTQDRGKAVRQAQQEGSSDSEESEDSDFDSEFSVDSDEGSEEDESYNRRTVRMGRRQQGPRDLPPTFSSDEASDESDNSDADNEISRGLKKLDLA